MESYLHNSFSTYFKSLKHLGYVKDKDAQALLIYNFLFNLITTNYRFKISKEDYSIIERYLNSLYGRNCIMPYSDYLKMGKLNIGELTEISNRLSVAENNIQDHETAISEVKDKASTNENSIRDLNNSMDYTSYILFQEITPKVNSMAEKVVIKNRNIVQEVPDIVIK